MEILCAIISILCLIAIGYRYVVESRRIRNGLKTQYAALNTSDSSMALSVLICAKSPLPTFSKYLERILEQDYHRFEVIVVISNIENTIEKSLYTLQEKYPYLSLKNLLESHPFSDKKQAMDYGIHHAQYEWIVTIDDDCYPESNQWLRSISQRIGTSTEIVLGLSPYISQASMLNRWIRYDWLQGAWNMAYHTLHDNPYMGVGRNMAFKKSLWTEAYLSKYQDYGHGDDTSLVLEYPRHIALMISPVVYSYPKTSLYSWIIQKSRHLSHGQWMQRAVLKSLIVKPLLSAIFWLTMSLWMCYLHVTLYCLGICLVYLVAITIFQYQKEKILSVRKKVFWLAPVYDGLHSFYILLAPFGIPFIPKKWK